MIVELPSQEERQAILKTHAARHPEPLVFTVPGDGGKEEKLLLLLGNPTKGSSAWRAFVGATFRPRTVASDPKDLVTDCVLWPDAATWGGIVRRWPALPETISRKLREKHGTSLAMIDEPTPTPTLPIPPLVVAAQARDASATWRRLKPADDIVVDLAIKSPDATVWELFTEEMKKSEADYWALALDFATVSIAASTLPPAELFDRWPGSALLIALCASTLGGLAAQCEKGEF